MTVDEQVAAAFLADHPDEAARVLERANPVDAAAVLASLSPAYAAGVYRIMAPSPAAACAETLPDDVLVAIVDALSLDDAGVAMRGIRASRHEHILSRLGRERRDRLRTVLAWDEHTAGALADPLALALAEDMTVAEAQRQLRAIHQHLLFYLYVVRRDGTLVGVLDIPELMAARPKEALAAVMQQNPVRLDAHADLATVAVHPAWRDLDALPVVDSSGRLVGAIRHKSVRRMSWARGRPLVETLMGLSEVYWAGLSGMLATLNPQGTSRDRPVTPNGEG
ncbi:MAG TPA: CBS domain-containing protein [Gemmatimonadaceae bacterium]